MGHPFVKNETPFAFDFIVLANEEGRPLLLLVVKATYAITRTGLQVAREQVPVNWAGEPWGAPGKSSYRYEPEGAFFKPTTDVVLIGHAYPAQRGDTEVLVALQVGPLRKALRVVGERTWFKSLGRVSMTKPRPFERIPLIWERSFGGWDRTNPDKPAFEPNNPVGVGFRASARHFEEGLMLPNLEDPEQMVRELGQRVVPAGVGFTSPEWQPRATYAGTYDEEWQKTRRPGVPKNFDRRFFNAAAPGLVAPSYLKGNEAVIIAHASPRGRLAFSLPGQAAPVVSVEHARGRDSKPELRLDTLILDTDTERVLLLWRGHLLLEDSPHEVRSLRVTAQGVVRPGKSGEA
jgi:hypothetical protein